MEKPARLMKKSTWKTDDKEVEIHFPIQPDRKECRQLNKQEEGADSDNRKKVLCPDVSLEHI